jgi:hypothetical protein
VPGHDHLAHGATGVVADERDVVEVERVEQIGDDLGLAREPEGGARRDRFGVAAEREVGGHDPVVVGEQGDDVVPQVAVHERTVHQHHRRAGACLPHSDASGGEVDGAFRDRGGGHGETPYVATATWHHGTCA